MARFKTFKAGTLFGVAAALLATGTVRAADQKPASGWQEIARLGNDVEFYHISIERNGSSFRLKNCSNDAPTSCIPISPQTGYSQGDLDRMEGRARIEDISHAAVELGWTIGVALVPIPGVSTAMQVGARGFLMLNGAPFLAQGAVIPDSKLIAGNPDTGKIAQYPIDNVAEYTDKVRAYFASHRDIPTGTPVNPYARTGAQSALHNVEKYLKTGALKVEHALNQAAGSLGESASVPIPPAKVRE